MKKIAIIVALMAMIFAGLACEDGGDPPTNTQVRDAWVTIGGINPLVTITEFGAKAPMCYGESVAAQATDSEISPACYEAGAKLMKKGKLPHIP